MRARLAVVTSVLLAACAGSAGSPPLASEPAPTAEVSIRVGPDGPELPEDVLAALHAYGAAHADEFGGLYVDDQGQGSFVLFFTGHLDEHAAALAEIWPRVKVREAQYTETALIELLESLDLGAMTTDGVEPVFAALDTINNRVTVELKSDDPTLELRLELQYGGMLDVTVHPLPGPWSDAQAGPGWRLLAAGEASHDEAYVVRAATDGHAWAALWTSLGLVEEFPQVDFDAELVVTFGEGIGSSCPEVRLDAVRIAGGVVFSETSDPLAPRACTDDLVGAVVFVVAIERSALPAGAFTLQLNERGGPGEPVEVRLP